jgi:arylformamidase
MKTRIIDLSHPMIPHQMNRKLEVKRLLVGDTRPFSLPDPKERKITIFEHPPDQRNTVPIPDGEYFLMSEIEMNTHAGTHIEIPYHCLKGKQDLTEFPLDRLFGPLVVLHLRNLPPSHEISLDEMRRATETAGGIHQDDVVFCDFGYDAYFFGPVDAYMAHPYPSRDAMKWIVDQGIRLFGVDAGMIERPKNPFHENHILLLENDIPLIENLAHLDRVGRNATQVYAFPLAMKMADSMPVRVVAIEQLD